VASSGEEQTLEPESEDEQPASSQRDPAARVSGSGSLTGTGSLYCTSTPHLPPPCRPAGESRLRVFSLALGVGEGDG